MGKQKLVVREEAVALPAVVGEQTKTCKVKKYPKFDKEARARQRIWVPVVCGNCGHETHVKHNYITRFLAKDPKRYRCAKCRETEQDELKAAINALNIRKAREKGLIK